MATEKAKKTTKTNKKQSIAGPIIGAVVAAIVIIAVLIGGIVLIDHIKRSNRAGNYEIVNIVVDGEDATDQIDLLKALGLTAEIELREDGTCHYNILGDEADCTYTQENITFENETSGYTYENGELVFEKDGNKLTFKKLEK